MKTIFAIFAVDNPQALGPAIKKHYPADSMEVAPGQWLVAAEGTAQSIATGLGITGKETTVSPAIVVSVSGYYGRASSNIWEWIKSKLGSPVG